MEEIKFAKLHGAKKCDIQETPEPWIFNCFLNGTTANFRTDLWDIYLKKIHGLRSMRKAELMVKHVHATRPVNVKEAEAREEINAIFHQSGKYCPYHKSNSHSAEECREMKKNNKSYNTTSSSDNKNWRDRKFRTSWKNKYKNKFKNYYKKKYVEHIPGVNCEQVGHSKANCRALKRGKGNKFKKRFGNNKAILAIAKALDLEVSENQSDAATSEEDEEINEMMEDSSGDENNIISDEDDDEAEDESNEEQETVAALRKLIKAKYKWKSPRKH